MTGFRPSDWDDDTALTVKFEKPGGFGFESLLEGEHLIEFSGVTNLYCRTGPTRHLGGLCA